MSAASTDRARHWVLLPAAGIGRRMGSALPKQYLTLAQRTVIEHTLAVFTDHPRIEGIVVVIAANDPHWGRLPIRTEKPLWVVDGADERSTSVLNGLDALARLAAAPSDWVLVHDAARPCLRRADLDRLLESLSNDSVGGLLAVPVSDTIKRASTDRHSEETIPREHLWQAQTPQMFRFGLLHAALRDALANGCSITDEASAIEAAGARPRLIEGHCENIKITRAEDLRLAEFYLHGTNPSPMD